MTGDGRRLRVAVTGAAGALGSSYVRALVSHGHDVTAIDRLQGSLRVPARLVTSPYETFGAADWRDVPVQPIDLAEPDPAIERALTGADAVVMTAANPLPFQTQTSADRNHAIDRHTIDAAIAAGVRVIIYTSSMWRLHGLVEGDQIVTPAMSAPGGAYGESKQRTVDLMHARARQRPATHFVVNDHGWYPREAIGAPPMNVHDRGLQSWVAERETQAHVLRQVAIADRRDLAGNVHGFIVTSKNVPPPDAVRHGHRPFIYDLSNSAALGVEHHANVYALFEQYGLWRDVPIYME